MFVLNLFLAGVWAALLGTVSLANLIFGFAIGYVIIWLLNRRGVLEADSYVRRPPRLIGLIAFFLAELVMANFRLARDVVTPGLSLKPAIIKVPLEACSDAELAIVANLITLTPGSLSVDVSPDRSALYVHCLYVPDGDVEKTRRELKEGFERRVLEVLR